MSSSTDAPPPVESRSASGVRRLCFLLAGLASLYVVTFSLWGGARERLQREQKAEDHARRARQGVTSSGTQLRPLHAAAQTVKLTHPWSRRVLGLYNSLDAETNAEANPVHLRAELVLNHLGLVVDHRDVNLPLPDEAAMGRYMGVVAWFSGQRMARPVAYLRWLKQQVEAGRKVVLLDGLGAGSDLKGRRTTDAEKNVALEALGLRRQGATTDESQRIEIVSKDAGMMEFERPLPTRLEHHVRYRLTDASGRSYLRLRRTDRPDSASDMVVTTASGGFAARTYVVTEHLLARNFVLSWLLDPYRFLARALDVEHSPRPDFTTLNGSRIFYSHIDGDGLPSITEIDRKSSCGDYTREQVLERYDLPVTVSFVVAGIQPPPGGVGDRYRLQTARRIARLPNVEVASHGFAHPMDWRARGQARCSYDIPGYKMNAEKEIAYSVSFINKAINPPGKPTMAMLWTGWCNPAADQLAIADRLGLYNLNGGDPIMDGQFPSYLHLAPPMHRVGDHTQYFTSGSNEYILTEEWKAPYHRWANVIQTFKNTNKPRRVYPINVYYHFYVVEKKPALVAMHKIQQWVLQQKPAPLWATQYLDVVRDFATVRLGRLPGNPGGWRVINGGFCRTVRFDRLDRHVDLGRSRGVIGYSRLPNQGALYVHLDEGHDHVIMLTPQPQRRPYLLLASAYLRGVTISRERVTFTTRGIGRKHISLANMTPGAAYAVRAKNEHGKVLTSRTTADVHGALRWQGKINGRAIEVVMQREPRP